MKEAISTAKEQLKITDPSKARGILRKALGAKDDEIAHHVITWQSRDHPLIHKAAEAGWNINGKGNGFPMPSKFHKGYPEWHRKYNEWLRNGLDELYNKNKKLTPEQAKEHLDKLTEALREQLGKMCQ